MLEDVFSEEIKRGVLPLLFLSWCFSFTKTIGLIRNGGGGGGGTEEWDRE